ncbi:uncharacterized protein LOC121904861 [Thunnus maccoyii]|uniref:uncharacterized protein LOC121904861 n=1 Tax=Thunnus maccoyii TaxID=8240 RepID=UPI001C4CA173|nr:uncharacterized protein LOC121904861 [Thunnus maccoyii]XP_042278563.1 uncharacterized protein LOC121904861 [Thunnus maccoyii]
MYRLNPDCWVGSPRPHLCLIPQHQGSLASSLPGHQEEEEEEEVEDHPAVCCYTTGCADIIAQAADGQWSTPELPIYSGIPSSSGLAGRCPASLSPQQPITMLHAAGGDTSQHAIGGHCWEGPGTETQGCVCVCGERGPEGLGPCWPGSPYIYYGVRRNVVVGVEVVEEVAVEEDTLEVITEEIYTDDLLDSDLLQEDQLYPT